MYIINYSDFITHVKTPIDLSLSRRECAEVLAKAYIKQYNKRKSSLERSVKYFASGAGMYHTVRDLIEKENTESFVVLLAKFKSIYPLIHQDWQSALIRGLRVMAQMRFRNYSTGPYIYNHPVAAKLRSIGSDESDTYISNIMSNSKQYTQTSLF